MAGKELQAIVTARERALAEGRRAALVTVVGTSGSTYRRSGARMLVLAARDGEDTETIGADFLGSISGGCLEDDAREHARAVIASGRAVLVHYDTTADSDIFFGTGAGCQGTVEAFIQPLPPAAADDPLTCIAQAVRGRRTGALASVITVEAAGDPRLPVPGDFLWVNDTAPDRPPAATTIADPGLAAAVANDARAALFHGRQATRDYPLPGKGRARVFIDVVRPPHSLLICGAGQDAVPLARLARELGWRVRVVDGRRAYITPTRFPGADEVIHCPAPEFATRVAVEPGEAVVIMTHNYLHDRDLLRALIPSPAGYLGVLGPRRRTERLIADLSAADENGAERRLDLGKRSLRRLHGPAGLDIGAEAPEQIALAIVAEIEAFAAGREGGMLKRRVDTLHRTASKDAL